jgi:signal transduction histidine kinase
MAATAPWSRLPSWWRAIAWLLLVVAAVWAGHGPVGKLVAGVLMAIAALGASLSQRDDSPFRAVATLVAIAAGLAVILLAPNGLGEVPVLVAAMAIPDSFPKRIATGLLVAVTVLFGLAIWWITESFAGLLAGLAVPFIAQRAAQRRVVLRERDRAQALLAELQISRDAEAQAAALRERGRIARDMHDVLAHSLAGLSLQLQAARAVAAKEGVSADVLGPLDRAADLARDGLAEARAAVGTLRDPVGLGVDDLGALVDRHPGDAELEITGAPGSVSPEAGHATYRAVQEALTNAARYAPGSLVTVSARWTSTALIVRIEDTGPGSGHEVVLGQGSGLGLPGMQERLAAVGGTVQAGPRTGGGWSVELHVPLRSSSADGRTA